MKTLFLTQADLESREWISSGDRELIKKVILDIYGKLDNQKAGFLRGYLVQIYREMVADQELRDQLPVYAAAWCDGWNAALRINL